jgi:hypothetical protein
VISTCFYIYPCPFVIDTKIVDIIDTIRSHSSNEIDSGLVSNREIPKGRTHDEKNVDFILNQMEN